MTSLAEAQVHVCSQTLLPDGDSSWAPRSYVEIGEIYRRTNITATLHRSELYGVVARLNPLLSEDTWKHLAFAKKAHKGPSVLWEIIFSGLEPWFQHHVWRKPCSVRHLQSNIPKVKCAGSSLMLWGCCSVAGTEGLVRVEEKLNAPKYRDSLNENPVQSIQNLRLGRMFTFQQDNEPKHTARVAYRQLCECPWVAQPEPEI